MLGERDADALWPHLQWAEAQRLVRRHGYASDKAIPPALPQRLRDAYFVQQALQSILEEPAASRASARGALERLLRQARATAPPDAPKAQIPVAVERHDPTTRAPGAQESTRPDMTALDNVSENFLYNCARILMGAAYADGLIDGIEEDTIINLLNEMIGDEDLPDEVIQVLNDFDLEEFNLEAVAEELAEEEESHRYRLLQMTASLREADGAIDMEEDEFMLRLAEALDLEAEYMEEFTNDTGFEPDEALLVDDYEEEEE